MKANPFIEATLRISEGDKDLNRRKSLLIFFVLKAIEMRRIRLDITRAPIAKGVALKTYFKSGK